MDPSVMHANTVPNHAIMLKTSKSPHVKADTGKYIPCYCLHAEGFTYVETETILHRLSKFASIICG